MKNVFIKGTSALLSTFLLVGCGDGACCEDRVRVLTDVQPKGDITVLVEKKNEPKEFIVPNIVPKAIAHANDSLEMIKISTCASVQYDAGSSYDPDGYDQNLSYAWIDIDSNLMSNEKSFSRRYSKKGLYETTLMVKDEQNLTAIDRVCILVNIDEDDIPLIARVSGDLEVNADEKVSLFGRGVCRDDISKYEWRYDDGILLSSEANFESNFEIGKYTLILTIEDIEGNRATDSVVINIL